jgi:hypothetical protein
MIDAPTKIKIEEKAQKKTLVHISGGAPLIESVVRPP